MRIKKISNQIIENQIAFKSALGDYYAKKANSSNHSTEDLNKSIDQLTITIKHYTRLISDLSNALDTDIETAKTLNTSEINKIFLSKGTIILKNKLSSNDSFMQACKNMENNLTILNKKIHDIQYIDANNLIKSMNNDEQKIFSDIRVYKNLFLASQDYDDPIKIKRHLDYCGYFLKKLDENKASNPDILNELRVELFYYIETIDSSLARCEKANNSGYYDLEDLREQMDDMLELIDAKEKIRILELDDPLLDKELNVDYTTTDEDDQLKLLKKFVDNFNNPNKTKNQPQTKEPARLSFPKKTLNKIKNFFSQKPTKNYSRRLSDISESAESSNSSETSDNSPPKTPRKNPKR